MSAVEGLKLGSWGTYLDQPCDACGSTGVAGLASPVESDVKLS